MPTQQQMYACFYLNAIEIPADIPLEEQQRIFEDLLRKTK